MRLLSVHNVNLGTCGEGEYRTGKSRERGPSRCRVSYPTAAPVNRPSRILFPKWQVMMGLVTYHTATTSSDPYPNRKALDLTSS
jgi:hypothetical protein